MCMDTEQAVRSLPAWEAVATGDDELTCVMMSSPECRRHSREKMLTTFAFVWNRFHWACMRAFIMFGSTSSRLLLASQYTGNKCIQLILAVMFNCRLMIGLIGEWIGCFDEFDLI